MWQETTSRTLKQGNGAVIASLIRASACLLIGLSALAGEAGVQAASAESSPRWVSEEVRIPSDDGLILAGTLRTPTGRGSEPFPALLFLRGSGPSQRGGVGPFFDRLLNNGVAILDYDKRGVGQSTGQFIDTLRNMQTDAAAAVKFLSGRPDIDGKRIAIAGHSQGGAVGPAVAAEHPDIAAVVMFAGPAAPPGAPEPGEEINLVIMKEMLAKAGASHAAIEQVSAATQRLFKAEFGKAPPAEILALREAVVQGFIACNFTRPEAQGALATLSAIILEAMNAEFSQTLARVRAPVLALYGSRDEIVPARDNLVAAKAALANNPDATVVEIPGVDHGFRNVTNVSTIEQAYTGPIAAPEVIELAAEWLELRLRRANGMARPAR